MSNSNYNNNQSNLAFKLIDELIRHLNRSDAISLGRILKIKNEQYKNVYFKDDAKKYLNDKLENSPNDIYIWAETIQLYVLARNCLFNRDFTNAFEWLTKSFKCLIDLIKDAKVSL